MNHRFREVIARRIHPSDNGFWQAHRFLILIIGTIIISIGLVSLSLVIYNLSGAAQLDLSRPGYQSVSDKVERTTEVETFNANGPLDAKVIDEFLENYDVQAKRAQSVDAFGGDPLNPDTLMFDPITP